MEPTVFASGYLIFRRQPRLQFLLMKHPDRWDLPKGHLDAGETRAAAALRELHEETAIEPSRIWTDPQFLFTHRYWVQRRKAPNLRALKELTIYLGIMQGDVEIRCTEHADYQWWDWSPPHRIQAQTIDPLLASVAEYLASKSDFPSIA